jgi:hypothetical protein
MWSRYNLAMKILGSAGSWPGARLAAIGILMFLATSARGALTLARDGHFLVIRGEQLPGGEIRINYLEAYCRAGSTTADWVRRTVIRHTNELVSLGADNRVLRLRDTLADGVTVEHTITAKEDEVDFQLTAKNPGPRRSEAHWAQPCVRLGKFTGYDADFGRGDLNDYLPKCFIFLEGQAARMPTRDWATEAPANVPRADVNPRPLSRLAPSSGLIGCFSGDDQLIFATAWEPYQELFQGVARCLHSDFRLGGLWPGETRKIRGKIYIVTNDIGALRKRYERDFPEHHQFSEKQIRHWTRQGALGEAPKRATEAWPLSDQENRGNWKSVAALSDEFAGLTLDTNKWNVGMKWWQGRQPAWFSPRNVTVSNGHLRLAMRRENVSEELNRLGYTNYTSAALHTRARAGYGYYEVRARPMNSGGSSSFWFQQEDPQTTPGWSTEIDVFELCGKSATHDRRHYVTLHVFKTPKEKRHWSVGGYWTAPWRFAEDFHVYGFEWDAFELKFYVDGVPVRFVENTHWHQPLYLIFDSETMPQWFGMPDDADLPSSYDIEYVRAWTRAAPAAP